MPLPYEYDQSSDRPDICIGTDEYHTPDDLTKILCQGFEDRGYTVAINTPFAGTMVPMRYYHKDKRVISSMIEINRRLYMNQQGEITDGYEAVKESINGIFRKLSAQII